MDSAGLCRACGLIRWPRIAAVEVTASEHSRAFSRPCPGGTCHNPSPEVKMTARSHRFRLTLLILAGVWFLAASNRASAQDITVTRGYVWMYGPNPGLLGLTIGGTRGFTF